MAEKFQESIFGSLIFPPSNFLITSRVRLCQAGAPGGSDSHFEVGQAVGFFARPSSGENLMAPPYRGPRDSRRITDVCHDFSKLVKPLYVRPGG